MGTGWVVSANDYLQTHLLVAYLITTVGIGVFAYFWSKFLFWKIKKQFPPNHLHDINIEGVGWLSALVGVLERAVITTLVIWMPSSTGAFVGGWMIVKAIGDWPTISKGTTAGSAYYIGGLLGTIFSILGGIGVGLLTAPWLLAHREVIE
jgi:hypothetical protein